MQNTQTAQHTPGPWRIGDAGLTVFGPTSDEPAPVTVAKLMQTTPRVDLRERQANARLIAAAPQLLAALEQMLTAFPPPKIRAANGFAGNLAHAAARDAIAAARGQ